MATAKTYTIYSHFEIMVDLLYLTNKLNSLY